MYLLDNPVLQRELLVNLRTSRAFILLFAYNALLGAVVVLAWPQARQLDLTRNPQEAQTLVNLFFLGQYVIASLMAPSFAAGAITGEKERKTYEMLLASPLRPAAIVLGKLLASLAHLALLIFTSLPIVMLCLPLGGVSFYEVLAAYMVLVLSVVTFGMISVACSSYFQRTASSLVVSYLLILPLALIGALFWAWMSGAGQFRLFVTATVLPGISAAICIALFASTTRRLLHPPDVGSEGNEVVDLEQEAEQSVGLVIQRDRFPDRLFAPAQRKILLPDGANPVYDKEMRSEIFAQGTLMLRVVIQVSMFLAIPLMAVCLFFEESQLTPWYISYVLLFNMLVGPVFSAGSVTSERERQTLELLLTTIISPWQILWGKLLAGLRVSGVLTSFLLWPVLLAFMVPVMRWNVLSVVAYVGIVLMFCVTTATLALFCSVLFRKTAHSLMAAYLMMIGLFCLPLAIRMFAISFFPEADLTRAIQSLSFVSPFAAAFAVPMHFNHPQIADRIGDWPLYFSYLGFSAALVFVLLLAMIWLFKTRWRVAE